MTSPPSPTTRTASFLPYKRDPETLARPWAIPGTPGMQHRIGGLEKADGTGNISYDPANHDFMVRTRQAKIDGIATSLPPDRGRRPARRRDPSPSSAGARPTARSARPAGGSGARAASIAQIHLRHLNPLPNDLGDILSRYDRVVCPEMNLGQLALLLRAKYLVDAQSHTQVRGLPFRAAELAAVIQDAIDSTSGAG